MNREIKFRGKRVDNGEWVYGFYMVSGPEHHLGERSLIITGNSCVKYAGREFIEVLPETVGQFTGLTDKNGKEIYEGDIIKCLVGNKSRRNDLYTIIYRLGCPSMDNGTTETPVSFASVQDQLWTNLDYDTKISLCLEITGNIHDND